MALLVDTGISGWVSNADLRDQVLAYAPGADVRLRSDMGDPGEIRMVAVGKLQNDLPALLPNLELVQKLGAGVETIVAHPALPEHVRVARLKPEGTAQEIAEYLLAHILRAQRHLSAHDAAQAKRLWAPIEPLTTASTRVGVLGLGHIGTRTATLLRDIGFQVMGWSRSLKQVEGVICVNGPHALPPLLGQCDYVCAILPSTPDTRGLFGPDLFGAMKPGSTLINVGRGDLIDETALVQALDAGPLKHAVLDVLSREPLPPESPLWLQPGVTITPHVSGWHLGDAIGDVAENYRRLMAGEPLLHEVDRKKGY
jgi:glyoxylate/hydroxypyruvate reductase